MYKQTTRAIAITVLAGWLGGVAFSQLKISGPTPIPSQASRTTTGSRQTATLPPTSEKEKEKIWNSPTMLHARAWVQEYCQRSAKITPAEAKQYQDELKKLTPVQMKLWLLKFDEEQERIKAQQAEFERHRKAMARLDMAVEKQTRKAYADINRDETKAANLDEKSLAGEKKFSGQMAEQNASERSETGDSMLNPYSMFGYGGYGAYGGFRGGYHVHYHFHY